MTQTIEMLEEQSAPGCFGSATCHSRDSDVCKACQINERCSEEVIKTLERIRGVVNVSDLLRDHTAAMNKAKAMKSSTSSTTEPKNEQPSIKPTRPTPTTAARKTKVENATIEIDEDSQSIIATLPVKAQSFAVSLCRSGAMASIKRSISKGKNPLSNTTLKWLSLAIDRLIQGGFTRSSLKNDFVTQFEWKEGTAGSYVSILVSIFICFEVAIEQGETLIINPNLSK
ncbi:hypothetical protein [Acinetobacter brisouii]|uniref:hypothetical protein n=1 Tax=Acinetobacter brisouii TaxID=396323 RepID=UPI00124D0DC5|nr:hypothetical protein [Acinetobacter brisouii]